MEGRRYNPFAIASVSVLVIALFFSGFAVGVVRGAPRPAATIVPTPGAPDGNPVGLDMTATTAAMLRRAHGAGVPNLCKKGCTVTITFVDASNGTTWPKPTNLQCGSNANCIAFTAQQLATLTKDPSSGSYSPHPPTGGYSPVEVTGVLTFTSDPCT